MPRNFREIFFTSLYVGTNDGVGSIEGGLRNLGGEDDGPQRHKVEIHQNEGWGTGGIVQSFSLSQQTSGSRRKRQYGQHEHVRPTGWVGGVEVVSGRDSLAECVG